MTFLSRKTVNCALMKCGAQIALGFALLLGTFSVAHASAVFAITTDTPQTTVASGVTITFTYQVQNQSGIDISSKQMSYYPSSLTKLVTGTTCPGTSFSSAASFLKNASCAVVLRFTAPNASGKISLSLGVCGGGVCSQPDKNNLVTATIIPNDQGLISIAITPTSPYANIPGTENITPTQLTATGTYSDGSTANITNFVHWTSSNTDYATVTTSDSTRGQVTGVSVPTGMTSTTVDITATDPTTGVHATVPVPIYLVIGSYYDQGYVYCLIDECAYLPDGAVGEVVAMYDLIGSGSDSWQQDTNNEGLVWGGSGIVTNAVSFTDGQSNTQQIYATLTTEHGIQANTYAAGICTIYNSGDGNNTWYLPASVELLIVYQNQTDLNNAGADLDSTGSGDTGGVYWSSTENLNFQSLTAYELAFPISGAVPVQALKTDSDSVRCVRAF